ncbi:MAG: polysaccharide biosynthesis C-terminal domain-containing protein, partial [Candidatus Magasanikbacteria bacterium]|nr:polysaccharide biosynthesis C-terminal domain-containing protein [Candidatus Magasanikbacteria bacterium]
NSTTQFRETISLAIKYLLLISVPLSVGIFILAKPIMLFAFGEKYVDSVPALQILIFSVIFSFISFPLGAALNASGYERRQTWLTGFTLLANISANLLYIPHYGARGAAIAALIGNILLGTVGFFLLPKKLKVDWSILLPVIIKLLIATAVMAGVVLELHTRSHNLLLAIVAGGLVYLFVAWLTGLIKPNEIKQLRFKQL